MKINLLIWLALISLPAVATAKGSDRYEQYQDLPQVDDESFHGTVGALLYQETFQSYSSSYTVNDSRALLAEESIPLLGITGKLELARSRNNSLYISGSYAHSESGTYQTPALYGNVQVENGLRNVSTASIGYEHRFDFSLPIAGGTALTFRSLTDDSLMRTANAYHRTNEMRYLEFYLAFPLQWGEYLMTPKAGYQLLASGTQFYSGISSCLNSDIFVRQSGGSGEGGHFELTISHIALENMHIELNLFYRNMAISATGSTSCQTSTGGTLFFSEPKNITTESGLMLQMLF